MRVSDPKRSGWRKSSWRWAASWMAFLVTWIGRAGAFERPVTLENVNLLREDILETLWKEITAMEEDYRNNREAIRKKLTRALRLMIFSGDRWEGMIEGYAGERTFCSHCRAQETCRKKPVFPKILPGVRLVLGLPDRERPGWDALSLERRPSHATAMVYGNSTRSPNGCSGIRRLKSFNGGKMKRKTTWDNQVVQRRESEREFAQRLRWSAPITC